MAARMSGIVSFMRFLLKDGACAPLGLIGCCNQPCASTDFFTINCLVHSVVFHIVTSARFSLAAFDLLCDAVAVNRYNTSASAVILHSDGVVFKFLLHFVSPVCVVDGVNHIRFDYLVNPPASNPTHSTRVFNQIGLDLLIQCFLEFLPMNTPTMQTIENIREKAEKAGYTITDVARHAGFDPSQVSRYVTGKTIPLVTSIQRLEESVDSLIQQRLRALNRAERAEE